MKLHLHKIASTKLQCLPKAFLVSQEGVRVHLKLGMPKW